MQVDRSISIIAVGWPLTCCDPATSNGPVSGRLSLSSSAPGFGLNQKRVKGVTYTPTPLSEEDTLTLPSTSQSRRRWAAEATHRPGAGLIPGRESSVAGRAPFKQADADAPTFPAAVEVQVPERAESDDADDGRHQKSASLLDRTTAVQFLPLGGRVVVEATTTCVGELRPGGAMRGQS